MINQNPSKSNRPTTITQTGPSSTKANRRAYNYTPAMTTDRCGICRHMTRATRTAATGPCELVMGDVHIAYWCVKFDNKGSAIEGLAAL